MRVSALIDRNVVSVRLLLDTLGPTTISLLHRYRESGYERNIALHEVSLTPKTLDSTVNILNPYYYTDLHVVVNGQEYPVMDSTTDEEPETENPINDYIYTKNQVILPEDTEVVIAQEEMVTEHLSLSGASYHQSSNLLSMEDIAVNVDYSLDDQGLRFFIKQTPVIVESDIIEWNGFPDMTIMVSGYRPSACYAILINVRGEERSVRLNYAHDQGEFFCFSDFLPSATKHVKIRVEFEPTVERFQSVIIGEIFCLKSYRGMTPSQDRILDAQTIRPGSISTLHLIPDLILPFGLRTLLTLTDDSQNKYVVSISNGRVRVGHPNGIVTTTNVVTKDLTLVFSDSYIKILVDQQLSKHLIGNYSIEGFNSLHLGANPLDPDHDFNGRIEAILSVGDRTL